MYTFLVMIKIKETMGFFWGQILKKCPWNLLRFNNIKIKYLNLMKKHNLYNLWWAGYTDPTESWIIFNTLYL